MCSSLNFGLLRRTSTTPEEYSNARGDATSRYYEADHFEILGVCLGKQTNDWTQFMFIRTVDLARHSQYPHKIAVMHRVPIPGSGDYGPWSESLETIIRQF